MVARDDKTKREILRLQGEIGSYNEQLVEIQRLIPETLQERSTTWSRIVELIQAQQVNEARELFKKLCDLRCDGLLLNMQEEKIKELMEELRAKLADL